MPLTSRVNRNIAANVGGRVVMMLSSIIFVPAYIHYLGVEAYGIIAFYTTLLVVFGILDLGLSAALNRELARRSIVVDRTAQNQDGAHSSRDLVRTLEVAFWLIGAVAGCLIAMLAPYIAQHWFMASALSPETLTRALQLMGLTFALQWPQGLYAGGLMGLQRQVALNAVQSVLAIARGLGAVVILALVSPTLEGFFAWQAGLSFSGSAGLSFILWRALRANALAPRRARFDAQLLKSVWRFAAGMTAISLVTILLMQFDKLLLSTLLPLEDYAHYVLAGTVATASAFMGQPIASAVFPKLTQLVASHDSDALRSTFHRYAQITALAVVPVVATVAAFAPEIILFWTRDAAIAANAAPIATLLVIGSGAHAMMMIPYMLLLAHGNTRITAVANTIAVIMLVPAIYLLATRFNGYGAAFGWLALNVGYVLILAPITFRKVLPGSLARWYVHDIGRPAIAAVVIAGTARLLVPEGLAPSPGFIAASAAGVATLAAATLASPAGYSAATRLACRMFRRTCGRHINDPKIETSGAPEAL